MSAEPKDQVALFTLLFGSSWEDPAADRRALQIAPGETLMTVTSGACNTLTLLLEDPGKVYAVDINPTQSWLLELKMAAIRRLEASELRAFLGLSASNERLATFEKLKADLTPEARSHWTENSAAVRDGVIHSGKFESFARLFSKVVGVLQGKRRIDGLFACTSLEQQREYFDRHWNTWQWRLLFKLLVHKRVLARRGLTVDYFKFDDGSTSFSDSFLRRSRRAICDIPAQSNYFLALYLMGRYRTEQDVPDYLNDEYLPIVRQRLERIEIVTAAAQDWMNAQQDRSIHCFALSNICELMSFDETARLFAEVARTGNHGARAIFRNLMIPREVPESLQQTIVLQEALSRELLATDRSFVYSRAHAYVVE